MAGVIVHRLAGSKKALDACRLVEALFKSGKRVVAYVSDGGRATMFDAYLWTFSQDSFVPHTLWDGAGDAEDPVVVVTGSLTNPNRADTLVIVDRLGEPERAHDFEEVHDLLAQLAEDEGKVEAWEAAGFVVREAKKG